MFDGVFIHYLVKELKRIENVRINKIGVITSQEYFFTLSSKENLLVSIDSNAMNVRLSKLPLVNSTIKPNFYLSLKKYFESSIIKQISQHNNDRILKIEVIHYDDLGYEMLIHLYIEFFGRNSNIIITTSDDVIIDCQRRCFDDDNNRVIVPKGKYVFPESIKVNPYNNPIFSPYNNYQGVSSLLYDEISYLYEVTNKNENSFLITNLINQETNPTIIKTSNKVYFYAFDIKHLEGDRIYFESISSMLEYYYVNLKKDTSKNNEQQFLKNYINKEISKINHKISKQALELQKATDDLKYEKIGNLLLSNIHLIRKGDNNITVKDYYLDYSDFIIELNPLLTPNQNATYFFKRYQKAKRALVVIEEQLNISRKELDYYNCLLEQLNISRINDLIEIYQELNIKTKNIQRPKKSKPNFTVYTTLNDDLIFVGKNNIQNNYLTNEFAKKTDYFFHVQNVPGSHVILRTDNLSEELIYLTGCIAAYYSSYNKSTNVCIDYTLVKNVRKIPGQKGSFVTYKNQKSVFSKPDIDYINKNTK